jgi:hypothetical protein
MFDSCRIVETMAILAPTIPGTSLDMRFFSSDRTSREAALMQVEFSAMHDPADVSGALRPSAT